MVHTKQSGDRNFNSKEQRDKDCKDYEEKDTKNRVMGCAFLGGVTHFRGYTLPVYSKVLHRDTGR